MDRSAQTHPHRSEDDVLALTPMPLTTAGERALFGELTRWDTGGSVKSAVVASIPLVDGPLQRRLSDAVLFVPEGVVVLRIAEVTRQSGVVTATPEGAWTIGPEGRPGEVLHLQGGGSTPLDGLMRAGMDVAVRLRSGGLEPGRIGRLTVLVGDVTGLIPADGDLGEGDHVCLLDTRSLLLGIARATRYAGVDNPRLWTTADVRAGLEALGLPGRGPVVEELNGEGFPYSPYVLRRPGLMAPAAMAVMADSMDGPVSGGATASAAAAPAAAPAAPAGAPVPTRAPTRDTVAIDDPDSASAAEDGGIGGLFAHGDQESGPVGPPRTAVFDHPAPGAFGAPPFSGAPPAPSWGQAPPVHESGSRSAGTAASGAGDPWNRRLLLMAVLAVVVVVLGVGAWLVSRNGSGHSSGGAVTSSAAVASPGPKQGDVQKIGAVAFTVEAVAVDRSCASHAYGQVASSLRATDCTGLSRALYSAQLPAGQVAVSVIRVRMPDTASARALRSLADRNGSGNISNLLREGVRYPGGPSRIAHEEYDSAVSGATVTIVEDSWADPAAAGSSAELVATVKKALALKTPPFAS
jgi:hypothetical protein